MNNTQTSEAPFRLAVQGHEDVTPELDAHGEFACPVCGHDDVGMWADDGEADLADWWQCEKFSGGCGANGAVMQTTARLTQNGLPVPD